MALGRKTGGRQKGTPNKTTVAVKKALEQAFDGLGGVPSLIAWAKSEPAEFYKLWAKLLPNEFKVAVVDESGLAARMDKARKRVKGEKTE